MNIGEFRKEFNKVFADYIRDKIDVAKSDIKDDVILGSLDAIYEINGLHGKRIRPYCAYLMYVSVGGKDKRAAIEAGIAIELLHSFALIHDDIIDKGNIRHGIKTVHEKVKTKLNNLKQTKNIDHLANSQAMLVGDLVLSWSYEAMAKLENNDQILKLFQRMIQDVVVGEMLDVRIMSKQIISDQELNQRDKLKTSSYTFIYPIQIGAALADKYNQYEDFCNQIGQLFGEVFQIQDDILDLIGEEGSASLSDLKDQQHTYLTQSVINNGVDEEKKLLTEFFALNDPNDEQIEAIKLILISDQNMSIAKNDISRLINEAKQMILSSDFESSIKKLWLEQIKFFETRFD